MRILIIDNGSSHIHELSGLFTGHIIGIIKRSAFAAEMANGHDCVVLSGSSNTAIAGNEEEFAEQVVLIRESTLPILGICLGFELIAHAFGASLVRLPEKITGLVRVSFADGFCPGVREGEVYEGHRWAVPDVADPLVPLAYSATGIEAVRHKDRPIFGLQFHPEMSGREVGRMIISHVFGSLLVAGNKA